MKESADRICQMVKCVGKLLFERLASPTAPDPFVVAGSVLLSARKVRSILDDVALVPPFDGGAVERHPRLVHGHHVLRARGRNSDSASGEQMPDCQGGAKRWRRELVKYA